MSVVFGEVVWNDLVRIVTQTSKWLQSKAPILVILPLGHFSICAVYLTIYFYLFGNHLSIFSTPGDIFSVSFTKIAPFYICTIYVIAIRSYDFENLEELEHPPFYLLTSFLVIQGAILSYIVAVIISEYIRSGYIVITLVWVSAIVVSLMLMDVNFRGSTKGKRDIFLIVIVVIGTISLSAAGQAQRDRFFDYQELIKDSPICGPYAIVNKLGDQYLVVRADNSRWLSDENCRLGAKVAPAPVRTYPQHWKIDFWPF